MERYQVNKNRIFFEFSKILFEQECFFRYNIKDFYLTRTSTNICDDTLTLLLMVVCRFQTS